MEKYTSFFLYLFIYAVSAGIILLGIQKNKKFVLFLGILIPVLFAGLRYDVGTDYLSYTGIFNAIKKSSFLEILSPNYLNIEVGFRLIAKLCSLIGNEVVFFSVCAASVLTPVIWEIKKNYQNIYIGTAVFIFLLGGFTSGFNGIRQAIAVSIVFYGYRYIFSGNLLRYILTILLAMLFHKTAVAVLPLYLLWDHKTNQVKLNLKTLVVFASLMLIISNIRFFLRILGRIPFFSKYLSYVSAESLGKNRTFWLQLLEFLIFLLFYKRLNAKDSRYGFFILCSGIALGLQFAAFSATYFGRLGTYYSVADIILFAQLPKVFRKKDRVVIKFLVIIYNIIVFFISAVVLGQSNLIPYRLLKL